jgi:hypothetical protein
MRPTVDKSVTSIGHASTRPRGDNPEEQGAIDCNTARLTARHNHLEILCDLTSSRGGVMVGSLSMYMQLWWAGASNVARTRLASRGSMVCSQIVIARSFAGQLTD